MIKDVDVSKLKTRAVDGKGKLQPQYSIDD